MARIIAACIRNHHIATMIIHIQYQGRSKNEQTKKINFSITPSVLEKEEGKGRIGMKWSLSPSLLIWVNLKVTVHSVVGRSDYSVLEHKNMGYLQAEFEGLTTWNRIAVEKFHNTSKKSNNISNDVEMFQWADSLCGLEHCSREEIKNGLNQENVNLICIWPTKRNAYCQQTKKGNNNDKSW